MILERLQKFLATNGVGSRRFCEQLITTGRVKVNGRIETVLGTKVIGNEIIEVDGQIVKTQTELVYIMLNKPRGYVTTVKDDRGRKTVLDLIPNIPVRLYPVGRLDYDTQGLLFLTNDGKFTLALTHPRHKVDKTYLVEVKGSITVNILSKLEKGIFLEDGLTLPAQAKLLNKHTVKNTSLFKLTIREGRNRQVRRMCEAVGYPVIRLTRVKIGSIELGDLSVGKYRILSREEVDKLFKESLGKP